MSAPSHAVPTEDVNSDQEGSDQSDITSSDELLDDLLAEFRALNASISTLVQAFLSQHGPTETTIRPSPWQHQTQRYNSHQTYYRGSPRTQ